MVVLKKGVSYSNFFAFIYGAFATICLVVFTNAIQSFTLTEIYKIDTTNLGQTTGSISLADEIASFIALPLWGVVSDKFGRRIIVTSGFILVSISLCLFPHGSNITQLILIRIIYAIGSSATIVMLTAVLGDYVDDVSLGSASGIMGFSSGLGAVVAIFGFVGALPQVTCLRVTYYTVAIFSLISAVISIIGLKRKDDTSAKVTPNDKKLWHVAIVKGMKYGTENIAILLAYMAGFMARSGTILVSIFVTLLVNKYYIDNNLCENETFDPQSDIEYTLCGEQLLRENKALCRKAFSQASAIGGIIQTSALIGAPFFGFLCDRLQNPPLSVLVSGICGVISYTLFGIFSGINPTQSILLGIAVIVGFSEIFMIISAQVLVTKEAMPDHLRGTVAGVYSFVGGLGILVSSYVGGWLFDLWFSGAPFILGAAFNSVICILAIYVVCTAYKKKTMNYTGEKNPA